MQEQINIKLELDVTKVNAILKALQTEPYKEVNLLIAEIVKQAETQIKTAQEKSKEVKEVIKK